MTYADGARDARRNTVALLVSRAAVSSLGWLGSILIARLLSPADWGRFSFIFGLLGLLSVVTDLGVGRVVLARLVEADEKEAPLVASAFIALRLLLGLLGYLVALAYVWILGYPATVVRGTAVAGLVVIVATPGHALTVLFQSRLRLTVVAAAEAMGQSVQLLGTVLAAVVAPRLLIFVLPVLANEIVQILWKLRGVRRGQAGPLPSRQVKFALWRGMLIDALPLTLGTALATMLYKVDLLLLSRLDTFESVGLYAVGYKFADLIGMVAASIINPMLTVMVTAWPHRVDEFRSSVRHTCLLMGLIASVAVSSFWASAHPILTLLYGPRFTEAASASQLVVAGASIAMLTNVGFAVLIASGRQRIYPFVGLVGLGLNVALNLILIPRMSYTGSAVATLITEVTVCVVMWALVARTVPVPGLLPIGRLAILVVATVAIVLASQALHDRVPWPLLVAGTSMAVFALGAALNLPGTRASVRTTLGWASNGPQTRRGERRS